MASSAKTSKAPEFASASNSRSQVDASNSENQRRNSLNSEPDRVAISRSIFSILVMAALCPRRDCSANVLLVSLPRLLARTGTWSLLIWCERGGTNPVAREREPQKAGDRVPSRSVHAASEWASVFPAKRRERDPDLRHPSAARAPEGHVVAFDAQLRPQRVREGFVHWLVRV